MNRPPARADDDPMFRRAILAAAFAATALSAGCASPSYSKLVSEDDVPRLAELKRMGAALPRATTLVETTGDGGSAVRLAVHELGATDQPDALVLIHGAFSDADAWRFIAPLLARRAHVLMIDLPGCGQSDKPPADLSTYPGDGVYAPEALAERTIQAAAERIAARPAPPVRLGIVGHSLGGLVAVRMFADERLRTRYSEFLTRVDRVVLIAPVDVSAHRPDPLFQNLAEASDFTVGLGLTLGIVREKCAEGTLSATVEGRPALREEADKRIAVLRDPAARHALQAMLRRAIPWREGNPLRPDWEAMERLEAGYASVRVPTLILWGRRDETLPISMGYKLAAQIPGAEFIPIDGSMHSPHIDDPERCAEAILGFTHARAPAPGATLGATPPGP